MLVVVGVAEGPKLDDPDTPPGGGLMWAWPTGASPGERGVVGHQLGLRASEAIKTSLRWHGKYTEYDPWYALTLGQPVSVRHAVLALLSEGPKYGLQLRHEFEARTGEIWPLNVGQVYTTLQRLERDGLVESDAAGEKGPQKGFRITAAGSEELGEWLHTPSDTVAPPRDELVIKVLVGMRVPGVDVHDVIQAHRRHLVETMQRYTSLKAEEAEHDVGLALVVDAELFRLEGVVRWLDAADGRLKRLPRARSVAVAAEPRRLGRRMEVRR